MIPEWLEARRLGDEAFEAAYDASLPKERALIKIEIASLYAWLEPSGLLRRRTEADKVQGLRVYAQTRPRNWAVVQISAQCCDPSLVVAAVLPPLAAGVWPVIAVLEDQGQSWQRAVLALELCGVETVYTLPSAQMEAALKHWLSERGSNPGMVVCLEPGVVLSCGQENFSGGGHMILHLPRPQKAGIWMEGQGMDLWALSFMHPGMECVVWSEHTGDMPPGFRSMCGSWTDFLQHQAEVVWVPNDLIEKALDVFPLVLGPGQEPIWAWPWYVSALAGHTRVGIAQESDLQWKRIEESCER